jgi:hypothetical protein
LPAKKKYKKKERKENKLVVLDSLPAEVLRRSPLHKKRLQESKFA